MKKLHLLLVLTTCVVSVNVYAQLEIQTSGDVVISKRMALNGAELSTAKGLHMKAPSPTNGESTFGLYAYIKKSHPLSVTSGAGVAIFGCTMPYTGINIYEQPRPSSYPFYAGVVGMSTSNIGVYGTTSSSLPTTWTDGNYAGYFDGNVKVNGTLTPSVMTLRSDNRLQENVGQLESRDTGNILLQLNPIRYTLKAENISTDTKETKRTHYGFVAQELQNIAPELIYEDGAGYLSIDYIELIPLLVQKVQELSAEVEELKKQVK